MLVSTVMRSERALAPGGDVVLEEVRIAINDQFPTLMSTLHFYRNRCEAVRLVGGHVGGFCWLRP